MGRVCAFDDVFVAGYVWASEQTIEKAGHLDDRGLDMMPFLKAIARTFRSLLEGNIKWALRFYPPYLGAGIWIESISDDFRQISVTMPLRFFNQNYVGTHFGGSLYSMCDPFYMLMLMQNLGDDYIVWDKSASINFKKPGKGTVRADFEISREQIESLKERADANPKVEPTFEVEVHDGKGDVVAVVEKTLHIRKKQRDD